MKTTVEISDPGKSVDGKFVKMIAINVIGAETAKLDRGEIELSVAFVPPETIRKINGRYRGQDCVTDVLSFTEEGFLQRSGSDKLREYEFLGELLICPKQVETDAVAAGTDAKRELAWVVMHGILHLFGYDHENGGAEAMRMRQKEEKYLKVLKLL